MSVYFKVTGEKASCPITLEPVDLKSQDTIMVVTSKEKKTDSETLKTIKEKHFKDINSDDVKSVVIYHMLPYNTEALYEWYVKCRKSQDPTTKRVLPQEEIERIKFRYENLNVFKEIPTDDAMRTLGELVVSNLNENKELDSAVLSVVRCHLRPDHLPNFMNLDRKEAEDFLKRRERKGKVWLIRPSSYRGVEFAKDQKGEYIPISENYAVSYVKNSEKGLEIVHLLIENFHGVGWKIRWSKNGSDYYETLTNFYDALAVYCHYIDALS